MGIKKIPVSKRQTYINEFETLVKQEIALHNKKVQESNQKLNNFQKAITLHKKEFQEKIKQFEKYCLDLRKHFDSMEKYDDKINIYEKHIKDFEKKQHVQQKRLNECYGLFSEYLTKEKIDTLFSDLKKEVEYCFDQLNNQIINLDSELLELQKKLNAEILEKEEDNKIFNANIQYQNNLLNELKDKVNESTINSEWAKKDMKKKQKSIFVLEKKFEYLDDKIKKLMEKVSE